MRRKARSGINRRATLMISPTRIRKLIARYGLTRDDSNRYTYIDDDGLRHLLRDSFRAAGTAAASDRNFSDDDVDYCNAIIDQLRYLHKLIFDDDFTRDSNESKTELLALLNASRADIEQGNDTTLNDRYGFIYGYADHVSAISDLMLSNHED